MAVFRPTGSNTGNGIPSLPRLPLHFRIMPARRVICITLASARLISIIGLERCFYHLVSALTARWQSRPPRRRYLLGSFRVPGAPFLFGLFLPSNDEAKSDKEEMMMESQEATPATPRRRKTSVKNGFRFHSN